MNFSARQGARKWPRLGKLVTAVAVLGLIAALPSPGQARGHGSFGLEELFGAPPREETEEARGEPEVQPNVEAPAKPSEQKPAEQTAPAAPAAPPVSACRQALTEDIAVAPSIPSVHGPGGCGGDDLVRLEAIVLPDKHRVAVTPP